MMIPTHEKMSSLLSEYAGDIGDVLRAVHRCSIGDGVAIPSFSAITSNLFTKSMSLLVVSLRVPIGIHISNTNCCPPQSNPSILVLSS